MKYKHINPLWAKQEFDKRVDVNKIDLKLLSDVLFRLSCITERHTWQTSEYDGLGYIYTNHHEDRQTELALMAYTILMESLKDKK